MSRRVAPLGAGFIDPGGIASGSRPPALSLGPPSPVSSRALCAEPCGVLCTNVTSPARAGHTLRDTEPWDSGDSAQVSGFLCRSSHARRDVGVHWFSADRTAGARCRARSCAPIWGRVLGRHRATTGAAYAEDD
jgi:hypothetical protein